MDMIILEVVAMIEREVEAFFGLRVFVVGRGRWEERCGRKTRFPLPFQGAVAPLL